MSVEVLPFRGCGRGFYAKAAAPDGFPPEFLQRKVWQVFTSQLSNLKVDLGAAFGINSPSERNYSERVIEKMSDPIVEYLVKTDLGGLSSRFPGPSLMPEIVTAAVIVRRLLVEESDQRVQSLLVVLCDTAADSEFMITPVGGGVAVVGL
ncbi:hypothetical protein Taro_028586 [Colocasia esculenta]|uniref:Uncharacterized protein n=1 Tax=Colocasia esculenta TaxID=4460 RepID=A0A843VHM5_COLES|nr:hypothetical protein [Colocasia esculenta]